MVKKIKLKDDFSPRPALSETHWRGRPPIVAVLGHIDHGKTTLLDYIRKSHVAEKEHGGITQHIGSYQVEVKTPEGPKKITFIDTPGHEAFAKMRSRGAKVADIAVLIVAGNEGVMPQTKESIKFINEAKIPMVVAINKVDLPGVVVEKIKKQLSDAGIRVEGYGGDVVTVPVSAKTGKGVSQLLEMIILVSEMEELTADPKGKFEGVVIESKMNHQRGPTATILVKNGTLKIGDEVTCEEAFGRIKAMFDENDRQVLVAPPGKPVEVLGFKEVVAVGSKVLGKMLSKPLARPDGKPAGKPALPTGRQALPPERELISPKAPQDVTFKIILKTDVKGSQEAISENLPKEIGIVKAQTGGINESDILLAKATGAAIIGFNVKVSPSLYKLANEEKVKIKTYEIIYKLLEEIDEAVKALTSVPAEEVFGRGEIIAEFIVKEERVAGVKIISGKICRGDKIKILRGEKEVGRGRIKSIHHLKEEIPMAEMGTECGSSFSPKLDFEEKDVIISYKI